MVISNLKIGTSYFFTPLAEFAKENIRYHKDEGCIQFINAVNSHIDQKKVHLKLRKGKGKNTTESPETTVVDFPTEAKEEENAA